jgi:2-oxoglutarate ferredoxin oxidoreductase subunit alpha
MVAYGLSSRICQRVVEMARQDGIKVGIMRPITLYPYPYKMLSTLADRVKGFLVVEMNAGQMLEDVKLGVNGKVPVEFYGRMGGIIPTGEEILLHLRKFIDTIAVKEKK